MLLIVPLTFTVIGAGPVLLESSVKLVGLPGNTLPFSKPGPYAFTLLASAGPVPLPPVYTEWNKSSG